MAPRTDIHRPAAIRPEDYRYVAILYDRVDDLGGALMLQHEREVFAADQARTGGRWATHEHGGTCHICGAWALYMCAFHHAATNVYIRTGFDCAEKLEMGADFNVLAAIKREVKSWRDFQAGKQRAQGVLEEAGLADAWAIYHADTDTLLDGVQQQWLRSQIAGKLSTLRDIVRRLISSGSLSEGQHRFLPILVDAIQSASRRSEEVAARDAERIALAKPVPITDERITVHGTVVAVKEVATDYGYTWKAVVESTDGYRLYGTIPSAICFGADTKGKEVQFAARVARSQDDPLFGFFSRPTKAVILNDEVSTHDQAH